MLVEKFKRCIKSSALTLAKGKELKGDDFYGIKIYDDLTIAVVCDGVGSALEGAKAAQKVTNYMLINFKNRPQSWSIEKTIKKFVDSINTILYQESVSEYERAELITTLAMVVIEGDRLYGVNIGDSRIYLFRDGKLTQLSLDQVVDGQEGVLSEALGIKDSVEPYYFENIVRKGDKILLCSDGLYNVLDDEVIKEQLKFGANFLVKSASDICQDNLPDDTTAVVLDILEENQKIKLKKQDLKIQKNLKIGSIIDGYELLKPLIQNEKTWLVQKKGVKYVMKFAPVEASEDENILDLFVKEAWNAKRLKAGFFPKAVIPKNRTSRYYLMEYLDGVTLKEYLKKRVLHIDDALNLAKTLLGTSQYLLKFDLVHGDIKPENIMVLKRDDKLIFKVIDFGSMSEIYSHNSKAGTPSYLAPERFKGVSINESTEIFAIGVVLYESLTKKFPYGEIEPFQTPIFKKPKRPHMINKNIPLWLESIILRAIELDEERRYQKYSEMVYELENSDKVKPYFDKDANLIERDPVLAYKIGFFVMLLLNIVLVYLLIK
jgi:serine/threonine protein phosphatase PrpC